MSRPLIRPSAWAKAAIRIFGAENVTHKHVTAFGCDIDISFNVDNWPKLQGMLDRLPDAGMMRMTLVIDASGANFSGKTYFNTDTDETVEDGVGRRPTLPTTTSQGSTLWNRVYGEGGGWHRAAQVYGEENISNNVILELRYPGDSPYSP